MVMMISKFNKLLGSKLVWIIFILLVIFAFVFSFTPGSSGMLEAGRDTSVATLNGETIDFSTLRTHENFEELGLAMRNQDSTGIDLEQSAYNRIALLSKAESLGIKATDADLNEAITQLSLFQKEGKFDPSIYQNVVYAINQNFRVTPAEFETFLRQELMLQKLRNLMYNSSLISPHEVMEIYKSINDVFTVEYINLTSGIVKGFETTDEQLQAYYDENKETYSTEAQARVQYIEIPYDTFEETIEVSEDELYAYYEANPDEFTKAITNTLDSESVTNELLATSAEDNKADLATAPTNSLDDVLNLSDESSTTITNLSFEEVSEVISTKLKRIKSKVMAIDKADVISIDVAQVNSNFTEVCQANEVKVKKTAMFEQGGIIENIDPSINLSQVAFELNISNQYERVTDTLKGSNSVYVAYLVETVAPRIKSFEEMTPIISVLAEQYYIRQELATKSDEIRTELLKSVTDTVTFKDAAEALKLEVLTTPPFSRSGNELAESPAGSFINRAVGNLPKNAISEVVPYPGGQIILHILNRTAADMADYETSKTLIENNLSAGKADLLLEDFQKFILKEGNFKPLNEQEADEEDS